MTRGFNQIALRGAAILVLGMASAFVSAQQPNGDAAAPGGRGGPGGAGPFGPLGLLGPLP
jgi:hypothetical protein